MKVLLSLLTLSLWPAVAISAGTSECVVFLHGLARSANSMVKIATAFEARGYIAANVGYPSRKHPIEKLAPMAVEDGIDACPEESTVHFVTHSLGGILVRYYLEENDLPRLGRVVMLAPPNQGSEVVDNFRGIPGFKSLNGPAGRQLGTDNDSVVSNLGPCRVRAGCHRRNENVQPHTVAISTQPRRRQSLRRANEDRRNVGLCDRPAFSSVHHARTDRDRPSARVHRERQFR